MTYKNKFFNKSYQGSQEFYEATENPERYKGFEIHKISAEMFHVVKNGVCVAMMAGINGAKSRIDDFQYHIERAKKFTANEWITPTNKDGDDYDIFAQLFEFGLCERKVEEKTKYGKFSGNKIYFRYNNL